MTDTAIAATTISPAARTAAPRREWVPLVIALAFVLGCRAALYVWMPERPSAFDFLYDAAARLLRDENPYTPGSQWVPYPLPAVLLAVPFTQLPLTLARPVFDVLVGWAFGYALWRHRGSYALLAVASGAYLFAMANGQTTPLMVAAALVPALGFLLAVRPNTAAALWIAWPSLKAFLAASLFLALSLAVQPDWPGEWWRALPPDHSPMAPPILRPFGFVLLLAALRWRTPEGRLLLAIACIPQSALPYELVALALIPANRLEMGVYVAGSWIAVAVAARLGMAGTLAEWNAIGWPVTLCAVYLPMLYLILRRQNGELPSKIEKERRRAFRLDDDDLQVEVFPTPGVGITARVTHVRSGVFTSETAPTRKAAERKAHDKLAGIMAERLKARRGS